MSPNSHLPLPRLTPGQNLNYGRIQGLTSDVSRAPGDSPPPLPRNTHGIASDVRHEVRRAISEVHHDVVNTQVMVRNMLKSQQEAGDRDRPVSGACSICHRIITDHHLGSKQVSSPCD